MFARLLLALNLVFFGSIVDTTLSAQNHASPCKSTVTGTLEVVSLESTVYRDKRLLRVWLPAGYSSRESSKTRYPVLYLFDGQDLFDSCTTRPGQDEWHVDEIMTDLVAKHAVQPLIVVGVDNSGPGRREEEYSRYSAMADAPQKLSAFMNSEVISLVDRRFRTISDRNHRGVGGASLGSLAALTLLLDQPDTFGLGLLESTSLQNGNGRVLQETSVLVQGPARVSVGVGTTEVPSSEAAAHGFPFFDDTFVAMNRTLADNLRKALMNRPEVKLTVQQGGQHQDRYWTERFGPAVRFLFPPIAPAMR